MGAVIIALLAQPCLQHSEVISAAATSLLRSDVQQRVCWEVCVLIWQRNRPARANSWLLDERAEMKC